MKYTIAIAMALAVAASAMVAHPSTSDYCQHSDKIFLRSTVVDIDDTPSLSSASLSSNELDTSVPNQFLVKVYGPVSASIREELEAIVGDMEYMPHNSFVFTATPEQAVELSELPEVNWVGPYLPEYKISPDLGKATAAPSSKVESILGLQTKAPAISLADRLENAPVERVIVVSLAPSKKRTLEQASLVADRWASTLQAASIREVTVRAASSDKVYINVKSDEAEEVISLVAAQPEAHWVQPSANMRILNKYAHGITQTGEVGNTPISDAGLTGKGEIVAVADTGLDHYSCFFHDESEDVPFAKDDKDIPSSNHRKLAGYWGYLDQIDYVGGHGSHVSGSVLGRADGFSKISDFNGMATDAKLAFIDIGCQGKECTCHGPPCGEPCDGHKCPGNNESVGLPADLNEGLFPWAYNMGARIHSNSWGGNVHGSYDSNSRDVDQFTWEHKDFLPVFAAGNDGAMGYYSIGSPATAKNTLTVGASDSTLDSFKEATEYSDYQEIVDIVRETALRPALCGSCEMGCDRFQGCQLVDLFKDVASCCDPQLSQICSQTLGQDCSQLCCPAAIKAGLDQNPQADILYNKANLAEFSSRGPTIDGRIKPDVVAPGNKILSAYSHGSDPSKTCPSTADDKPTDHVLSMQGTSMATPVTAGNAALVRQYFKEGKGGQTVPNPSGALVKAALVNSGTALPGLFLQQFADGMAVGFGLDVMLNMYNNDRLTPSVMQGFGKIELAQTLAIEDNFNLHVVDMEKDSEGLETGDDHRVCVVPKKGKAGRPVKVTLVYTDYPSAESAMVNLVNDLDLSVCRDSNDNSEACARGNGFSTTNEEGETIATSDKKNNVEQVVVANPKVGEKYTIVVHGANVPHGPQPYALVVSGDFEVEECEAQKVVLMSNICAAPAGRNVFTKASAERKSEQGGASIAGLSPTNFAMAVAGMAAVVIALVAAVAVRKVRAVTAQNQEGFQPLMN